MWEESIVFWALKLVDLLGDVFSEIIARVIDLLHNASVSLVLSVDDVVFSLLLVFGNGFRDLRFFSVHSLLKELLRVVKQLNKHLSVRH